MPRQFRDWPHCNMFDTRVFDFELAIDVDEIQELGRAVLQMKRFCGLVEWYAGQTESNGQYHGISGSSLKRVRDFRDSLKRDIGIVDPRTALVWFSKASENCRVNNKLTHRLIEATVLASSTDENDVQDPE